jgi:hypothetical protein
MVIGELSQQEPTPPLELDGPKRAAPSALATQDRIDALARRINAVYRKATLEVVCAVGEMVILELYDGSIDTWGREGTRRASYRKLASRGDLLLSPSALCRAVAVFILCKRIGGRSHWRHLTASHIQEVLALEPSQQEHLLDAADVERWSVSRLRQEVHKQRTQSPRIRQRRLVNVIRDLTTFLAKRQELLVNPDALRELDGETAEELREAVRQLSEQISNLQRIYAQGHAG